MTAEQILRAAADKIRTVGWLQFPGRDTTDADGMCMLRAIHVATPKNCSSEITWSFVDEVTGIPNAIYKFNDYHCRTADDAIAALLIAADLAAPEWKP